MIESGEKITDLMHSLAKREQESIDALNEAQNVETKLGVANETYEVLSIHRSQALLFASIFRMASMRLEIEQKDAELAELRAIQGEYVLDLFWFPLFRSADGLYGHRNLVLKTRLDEVSTRFSSLEVVHKRYLS